MPMSLEGGSERPRFLARARWRGLATAGHAPGNRRACAGRSTGKRLGRFWDFAGRLLVLVQLLVLAAVAAASQGQAIQATVDRNQVAADEQVRLSVRVEGNPDAEPVLPEMPGFDVVSAGRRSEMSIVNGRVSQGISFDYLLIPKGAGEFVVPAVTVAISGQPYSTRPFSIRVVEASAVPTNDRNLFVTARVSKANPYVGEQVLFTWRFYRRVAIADPRLETLDFPDLVAEDLGEVREYQTTVNGVQYMVSEIRKALFAQRPGTFTIPASKLTVGVRTETRRRRRSVFDDFMSRGQLRTEVLRSTPIQITARRLPEPPNDFSGLVGDFDVQAAVSRVELAVGESTTLEVTVSGSGNAHMISPPTFPDLSDFKVYDDRPTSSLDRSTSKLRGSKVYRKALVPVREGELALDPVELVWFDPDAERYERKRTEGITLDVAPSDGAEDLRLTEGGSRPGRATVQIVGDDIRPIVRDADALGSGRGWSLERFVVALAWIVPPLVLLGLWFWRKRQERYSRDLGLKRRETAARRARADAQQLESATELSAGERAERTSLILRGYIGDRTGAPGAALTPPEAEERLLGAGVPEALARRVREILDRLEAARFGGANPGGAGGRGIEALIGELESAMRKKKRRKA